jgi:hypothetical protein
MNMNGNKDGNDNSNRKIDYGTRNADRNLLVVWTVAQLALMVEKMAVLMVEMMAEMRVASRVEMMVEKKVALMVEKMAVLMVEMMA